MMASISRSALLVTALLAMPLAEAMAQSNPTGNYGSNRSATAGPITADKPGAGLSTADVGSSPHKKSRHHKVRPTHSATGRTGKTVVPGSHSTVTGDADATARAQSGSTGGSGR